MVALASAGASANEMPTAPLSLLNFVELRIIAHQNQLRKTKEHQEAMVTWWRKVREALLCQASESWSQDELAVFRTIYADSRTAAWLARLDQFINHAHECRPGSPEAFECLLPGSPPCSDS